VLVGLSLPLPLLLLSGVLIGAGGIGAGELWLLLGLILLLGLPGTVLGVVALSDIRESNGSRRGVPLALFAALTWPLLCVVLPAVALPWLIISNDAGPTPPARVLLRILVPRGATLFALWVVRATARWATRATPSGRRIPKTAIALALATGVLMLALNLLRPRNGMSAPPADPVANPQTETSGRTAAIGFAVPPGQVAVFTPVFWSNNVPVRLPDLGGFVLASKVSDFQHLITGRIYWEPQARSGDEETSVWAITLESDNAVPAYQIRSVSGGERDPEQPLAYGGTGVTAAGTVLPRAFDVITNAVAAHVQLTANSATSLWLARTNAAGFGVSLEMECFDYPAAAAGPELSPRVGTGTDWRTALRGGVGAEGK
jgi:hypothetical protein